MENVTANHANHANRANRDSQSWISTDLVDRKWLDVNIPCQVACPIMTDIPGYIQAIMQGNYQEAYLINRMDNVLPGVLGRVCNRPCETACRHGRDGLGDPVSICFLKRSAADFGMTAFTPPTPTPNGKKVCVIGAGPAGLTAANDLAIRGYRVTILEQFDEPGGMLRYGIPAFRLPTAVVAADVASITNLGVEIKTGVRIHDRAAIEKLQKEYDAVLLAGGCMLPKSVNIPGLDSSGVFWGLDFMIAANRDAEEIKRSMKKVIVTGGGFTAVDCARMAHRLGAEEVTLVYRRTKNDMYVGVHELEAMEKEGIHFAFLVSPSGIESTPNTGTNNTSLADAVTATRESQLIKSFAGPRGGFTKEPLAAGGIPSTPSPGRVTGLRLVHNRIDPKDRSISAIPDSEFVMEADTVIFAVGQEAEKGILQGTPTANENNLFQAGDFRDGASTVIQAAAAGRQAAREIHRYLTPDTGFREVIRITPAVETGRTRDDDFIPRRAMPETPLNERRIKNKEVELGFSKEQSLIEARRCYLCFYNFQIDIERCIYCMACIDVMPVNCIKMAKDIEVGADGNLRYLETKRWDEVQAITIDNDQCIRCGNCVRACPVDCISLSKYSLEVEEKGASPSQEKDS